MFQTKTTHAEWPRDVDFCGRGIYPEDPPDPVRPDGDDWRCVAQSVADFPCGPVLCWLWERQMDAQ